MSDDREFEAFAQSSAERLRATAFMLCRDWHLAQDLTQTTLTKVYLAWRRASHAQSPLAYAQKVLLRTYLDHRRRRSATEATPGTVRDAPYQQSSDLRLTILDALSHLSPRDRAIVVLRYIEDYTVEQTADVLEVSESVVKSQTKRSLAKLRDLLGADQAALFA